MMGLAAWSTTLREEDALRLPKDLPATWFDVGIDWMFMHGLDREDARHYLFTIKGTIPKYFML